MQEPQSTSKGFVQNYRSINDQDLNLRGRARKLFLDVASIGSTRKSNKKPCVQLLYFHHVFDDEIRGFEELVAFVSNNFTVISHSEAIRRIATNNIDDSYVAFSSDDGFANNKIASKILAEYGISACFFLNPNSIGLTSHERIRSFCSERLSLPPVEFLNWKDVASIQKDGHEIGSHSLDHLRLAQLSAYVLEEDLSKSKEIIESHCGTIKHFAVPYGTWNDFNQRGIKMLGKLGFESCAAAVRGCHRPRAKEPSENVITVVRDLFLGSWPLSHTAFFMRSNLLRNPIPPKGLWM